MKQHSAFMENRNTHRFSNPLALYEYATPPLSSLRHHPNFENQFAAELPKRARLELNGSGPNFGPYAVLNHINYRVPTSHYAENQVAHRAATTTGFPTSNESTYIGMYFAC